MTRVVLDTNVLISAFLWRQISWKIFELASQKKVDICISREIMQEFSRVLFYPHIATQLNLIGKTPQEVADELLTKAEYYEETPSLDTIKDDPSDNHILACAAVARPDYIISGDQHLLKLKSFSGISILSPRQFLKVMKP